jgi:amidase
VSSLHAFGDDVLGELDGLAVAALVRDREVSRREVLEASLARLEKVDGLRAVQLLDPARALAEPPVPGPFSGVPTFLKDNVDLAGYPTNQGSEAFTAKPAKKDSAITRTVRGTGLVVLGKSRMPEFGFNASTEFMTQEPVRNPWHTDHSSGASSGGAAALVAAGVVPLAHANDGGGSIRIPAACCGLVGLKPTRGRFAPMPLERVMPLNIVSDGVVTRTVRDTAHFLASAERRCALRPIGLVEGPGTRRLRVGLVLNSVTRRTDDETRAAVQGAAELLTGLGHHVEEVPPPLDQQFADDFALYWGFLGFATATGGPLLPGFDRDRLDTLTVGLAEHYRRHRRESVAALRRLRASQDRYAQALTRCDVLLSPVLAHTTPEIGYLSPRQPFAQLFERLLGYVAFTPLNNASGSPAVSLPLGRTASGLPIGVQLAGAHGDERTLLELAYELEAAQPFRTLAQPAG